MSCVTCEVCNRLVDTDYFPEIFREGFYYRNPLSLEVEKYKGMVVNKTFSKPELIFTDSDRYTAEICDNCWEEMSTEEQNEIYENIVSGHRELKYRYW